MINLLSILKRSPWYCRLKYSSYGKYLLKRKYPQLHLNQKDEEDLFRKAITDIRKGFLVFDIGGSIGGNTEIFLNLKAKVIVLEPNKANFACLKARFGKNKHVELIQKAVSNQIGKEKMYIQQKGASLHTLSSDWKNFLEHNDRWSHNIIFSHTETVETTTIEQLIQKYGQPHFIKIDVEGFEYQVIQGLNQSVNQLCFEANLPQFTQQTINCIKHLVSINDKAVFNYSIDNKLELDSYISKNDIIHIVSTTKSRYMDIFCKMPTEH